MIDEKNKLEPFRSLNFKTRFPNPCLGLKQMRLTRQKLREFYNEVKDIEPNLGNFRLIYSHNLNESFDLVELGLYTEAEILERIIIKIMRSNIEVRILKCIDDDYHNKKWEIASIYQSFDQLYGEIEFINFLKMNKEIIFDGKIEFFFIQSNKEENTSIIFSKNSNYYTIEIY